MASRSTVSTLVAVAAALGASGFAVSAVAVVRAKAAAARSKDNLRTIYQGMDGHAGTYGFFPGNGGPPPEAVTTPDCRTKYPDSEAFRWGYGDPKRAGKLQTGSWAYAILPYVGEEEAFRKQDHSRAVPAYYIGARRPAEPQSTPRELAVYPKYETFDAGIGPTGRTDYAANDQVCRNGAGNGGLKPDAIRDGLAETLLAGEKALDTRSVAAGFWYWDQPIILGNSGGTGRKGSKLLRDSDGLGYQVNDNWGSPDPDGVWFLFCDGHARKLPYATPPKAVAATVTPSAGDVAELD
jgi:hypothetical protein